jgi:hypothetical protein
MHKFYNPTRLINHTILFVLFFLPILAFIQTNRLGTAYADLKNPKVRINADYDLQKSQVVFYNGNGITYKGEIASSFRKDSTADNTYIFEPFNLDAKEASSDEANSWRAEVTIDGKSESSKTENLLGKGGDYIFEVDISSLLAEGTAINDTPGDITAVFEKPICPLGDYGPLNTELYIDGEKQTTRIYSLSEDGQPSGSIELTVGPLAPGSYQIVLQWKQDCNNDPDNDAYTTYTKNNVEVKNNETADAGTITGERDAKAEEVIIGEDREDEAERDESCEDNDGEFVFFTCAIIGLASGAINTLDGQVRKSLDVKEEYYRNDGIKDAWASIRNVAYVLLIPVMLVMVIGTALGFSFVDAYTVKRALPRMFAAIIFMALSYDICIIMIEVVSAVGGGIGGLIATPFGGSSELTLTNIFSPSAAQGGNIFLGTGIIAGIAVGVGALSLGILASYLLIGAVSLIIIFAMLTLREMILLFLIILAPLAIISWIFPGNDKLWKLWWSSFSKLLYLFPLIVGLLVTGRAFASIINTTGADGIEGVFLTFAKLVAYIGPFFFIPALFKFAGGAFGNIAGMANDRSKGLFDRQRKYRGNKRVETKKDALEGNRFKNTPGLRRFNNTVGKGMAAPGAGLTTFKKGGLAAQYSKNTGGAAKEFGEKNHDYAAFSADDDVLAASLGKTESDVRDNLKGMARYQDASGKRYDIQHDDAIEQSVQMIMQAKKGAGSKAYKKAAIQDLAKAGTYFEDAGHMAEMINETYGNDRAGAGAAMIAAKNASMSSGRVDIGGAGAGDTLKALGNQYNATRGANRPAVFDAAREAAANTVKEGAVKAQGAQALAHSSMKPRAVEALMPVLVERMETVRSTYGEQSSQYKRELASVANLYDTMSQTSPQNADLVSEMLLSQDPSGSGKNIQQQIEASRADPGFVQYRREYGSANQDPNNPQNRPPEMGGGAGGRTDGRL